MVKQVRITLENQEHEKFLKYKLGKTWCSVLKRGVEASAYFPEDVDWVDVCTNADHYLLLTDGEGELK